MTARRVIFDGRVQGVGFRYTVKHLAHGFDVCGWVKNLPNGDVELQIMGELDELNDFIHEITIESNVASLIKNHYVDPIPLLINCKGFRIERSDF